MAGSNEKEKDVPLEDTFEYSYKGSSEAASFIKILAPSAKNLVHCADLKQAFYRATKDAQSDAEASGSESKEKITGSDIIGLMYGSEHVEMSKVFLHAKELLTSGVCLVDGEAKLTKPLFDEMSQDDLEVLLGEYLVNFILRSALKKIESS